MKTTISKTVIISSMIMNAVMMGALAYITHLNDRAPLSMEAPTFIYVDKATGHSMTPELAGKETATAPAK